MANFILTPGQDIITGTSGDDVFFANQGSLNSGDQLNGGGGFDIFDLSVAGGVNNFSAFQLNGIERFQTFVASGATANIDLSGSNNVAQIVARFTAGQLNFTNADIEVNDLFAIDTVASSNLFVQYGAGETAGTADQANLFVDNAGLNILGVGLGGVETLNITAVDGSTTIGQINSAHVNYNLSGTGNIAILTDLNPSVMSIDATGLDGNLVVSFSSSANDVTVIGAAGNNTIVAGSGDNTITAFD
ncbi:MAG: hypothetical protein AAFY26_03105, partial [Cyanobacteria bacterium J06638_22]